ncbi:hypothetical protein Cni_G14940 [Canna indica]|uniref:C2H2-type domain-containing protein n=1 Tax=Canna indica TaxID=4628 RepID=A0AAQ3QEF7_9LILI|nr:hypothetical protein Cni_G14940 [Canna indica]
MNKYACSLCPRRFSNGRALGGHMRSHVVSGAPPVRPRVHGYSSGSTSSGQVAVDRAVEEEEEVEMEEDEEKEIGLAYGLRMNPRKSFRLVDPEFSSADPSAPCVVVQDRESEAESPRTHRPRSKRPRRVAAPRPEQPEAEPASSVSDASPPEDVAFCLMLLSQGSWDDAEEDHPSDDSVGEEEEEEEEDDEDDFRAAARSRRPSPPRGRKRYQCDGCKKCFRSYQALGGHRASHKRTNGCVPAAKRRINAEADSVDAIADGKLHECPFCFRVFASGQALGGHKRSHLTTCSTAATDNSRSSALPPPSSPPRAPPVAAGTTRFTLIDLNMPPAPTEDEIEMSAISEF